MKKPFVRLVIIIVIVLGGLAWLIAPGHKYLAKRNTDYSISFTNEKYAKIKLNMKYADVIQILGEPVSSSINDNYPVWALRNSKVRNRLGKDKRFDMKVLEYSKPLDAIKDYELIHLAFCPELLLINKEKWVTD